MDIRSRIGSLLLLTTSQTLWSSSRNQTALIKPCFSRKNRPQQSGDNDDDDDDDNSSGGKFSTDWDKAWTRFKKQGKKTIFSEFSPNKYVSRNPRPSNYPLSEEVDPIKRAERSNLMLWTSPSFTLGLAIVIVTFLMVYTILAPIK